MHPADPIAAVTHRDPYPYYREMALSRPFHYDATLKLWVAASASAVAEVLGHADARVRPPGQPVPPALAASAAGDLFGRLIRMNDGAAHAALKSIVMQRLAALDLDDVRRRAAVVASGLARTDNDDAREATRWMFTLPVLVVADILGLTLECDDAGHVGTHVAGFVATFAAGMSPLATAADVDAAVVAAQWLTRSVQAEASRASAASSDGLLHALSCDAALASIDAATLVANAVGLMIQACEATAGLVGNTLVALAHAAMPPDDVDALVAQVARLDPPVQNTRRFLAVDAVVCGQPLKANDAILVLLAAAAHDPAGQGTQRPWTFGAGRHACPGDALAQVLAACTVRTLLARDVRPDRLVRAMRYRPSVNARIPQFLSQA